MLWIVKWMISTINTYVENICGMAITSWKFLDLLILFNIGWHFKVHNSFVNTKLNVSGWYSYSAGASCKIMKYILLPGEGALGRGNRCVHQAPYPAVTGQTQGSCHRGRPMCLKCANRFCKYSVKLKKHAYVMSEISHLLQFACIVLSTLVNWQRGVDS